MTSVQEAGSFRQFDGTFDLALSMLDCMKSCMAREQQSYLLLILWLERYCPAECSFESASIENLGTIIACEVDREDSGMLEEAREQSCDTRDIF